MSPCHGRQNGKKQSSDQGVFSGGAISHLQILPFVLYNRQTIILVTASLPGPKYEWTPPVDRSCARDDA